MAEEPDLVITAGFSDAKLVQDTNKVVAQFRKRGEEAQKAFQDATGRVTNTTAAKAHARDLDRLSKAYDPVYRAAKQYEVEVGKLDRALKLGAVTQDQYNAKVVQAAQAVQTAQVATAAGADQMASASRRAATSTVALSAGMDKAGGVSGRLRSQIQNASFQFSDFIVQVQGGTAATTAFAQQAPQLLGGFGAIGAVLGLVAALAVPVGVALYKLAGGSQDAADMAEEFDKSLQSAKSALDDFNSTIDTRALGSIDALIEKYGRADQAVKDLEDRMRSAFKSDAFDGYNDVINEKALGSILGADSQVAQVFARVLELRDQAAEAKADLDSLLEFDAASGMEGQFGAVRLLAQQNIQSARDDMQALNDEVEKFGITPDQIKTFNQAKNELQDALEQENFQGAIDSLDTIQAILRETGDDTLVNVANQLDTVGQHLREGAADAGELPPELADAANEAAALADYLKNAVGAINSLQGAIANLGISNVGKQARLAALRAGQSAGNATIAGQVATRRAELEATASPDDANFTGIERDLSLYKEGLEAELALENEIGSLEDKLKPARSKGSGKSKSKKKAKKETTAKDIFEDAADDLGDLERRIFLIGKTTEEIAKYEAQWKIMDELQKAGIPITKELSESIEEQSAAYAALASELENAERSQEQFDQAVDGIASSMAGALLAGESLREGLAQVFKQIAADILSSGIRNAITSQFGAGSGGGLLQAVGSFFGGGTKLPSFDGGGFTGLGSRSGGIDGRGGFPALLHPNETVVDHTKGQGGPRITINNNAPGVQVATEYATKDEVRLIVTQAVGGNNRRAADAQYLKRGS